MKPKQLSHHKINLRRKWQLSKVKTVKTNRREAERVRKIIKMVKGVRIIKIKGQEDKSTALYLMVKQIKCVIAIIDMDRMLGFV